MAVSWKKKKSKALANCQAMEAQRYPGAEPAPPLSNSSSLWLKNVQELPGSLSSACIPQTQTMASVFLSLRRRLQVFLNKKQGCPCPGGSSAGFRCFSWPRSFREKGSCHSHAGSSTGSLRSAQRPRASEILPPLCGKEQARSYEDYGWKIVLGLEPKCFL